MPVLVNQRNLTSDQRLRFAISNHGDVQILTDVEEPRGYYGNTGCGVIKLGGSG